MASAADYIRLAFRSTTQDWISAGELYDFVVTQNGVYPSTYKNARKAVGLQSERRGKRWYYRLPEGQVGRDLITLRKLQGSRSWDVFLADMKVALKELKSEQPV